MKLLKKINNFFFHFFGINIKILIAFRKFPNFLRQLYIYKKKGSEGKLHYRFDKVESIVTDAAVTKIKEFIKKYQTSHLFKGLETLGSEIELSKKPPLLIHNRI